MALSGLWAALLPVVVHLLVGFGLALRVIMRRPPTGVALAWLVLIAAVPYLGAIAYLLVGERRIGRERSRRLRELHRHFASLLGTSRESLASQIGADHPVSAWEPVSRLGEALAVSPIVRGSQLHLFSETDKIFAGLIGDIEAAQTSVLMEFYIWHAGGQADQVLEALIRAAGRGVRCKLLIDALGARPWWRGTQPARLRAAGVELRAALPVGLLRTSVGRTDLRLHRKIVVIDSRLAWTGSMNLVDPRFFKQGAGVGQWVDAMARVQGAAVVPLLATLLGDWVVETGETPSELIRDLRLSRAAECGTADLQVIPTGPGQSEDALLQMIVAGIHATRSELVLTTPYLIPDDALSQALRGAALRGVNVTVILPAKVDSFLTRHACRSYFDELLAVGVKIRLYQGGLLHTKSIRFDRGLAMFGTVNLDRRSFWLNYEVALFVYDDDFTCRLAQLQSAYLADCTELDPAAWGTRPFGQRLLQNTLRLASPLL